MLFMFAGVGWAAETKPIDVKVGVELLSIRNVNVLSGEFEATFNLSFKCSADCEPAGFMLENGKIPFDRQLLSINLLAEDPTLRFELDPEETPTKLELSVVDWNAGRDLKVVHMGESVAGGKSGVFRYSFSTTVSRSPMWSFLRFMFPALALMFSAFLVLLLPDDFKSRLGMSLASFIGLIFLQLSFGGRVPVRDGLPFWDMYLVISYIAVALLIVYLFVDNSLKERELFDIRKRLTAVVVPLLPGSWAVLQLIVVFTTFR